MRVPRVLILEDDPLVSSHLEAIVQRTIEAEVVVTASVAEAGAALSGPLAFACLDVDVLDGKTYTFAATLSEKGVPFAFISASKREHVPDALRHVPFIAKPYSEPEIIALLRDRAHPA